METFDVAIVGGGPAGSTCAAFCAGAGLRTLLLEREKFPREKVCGDCLNPSCWPVLNRLDLAKRVWALPHAKLESVEFIAVGGRKVIVDLPSGDECQFSVKRSLFDHLLLKRAGEFGAHIHEATTVAGLTTSHDWKIETGGGESFAASVLVGADGRNSTVARLCNLLPRPERERIALQSHLPLPDNFGNRVVLQLLPNGYVGLSPVNGEELNVCLIAKPSNINALKRWATKIVKIVRGEDRSATGRIRRGEQSTLRDFVRACGEMYRGRLWINRLARAAVLSPRTASFLSHAARVQPVLRSLTAKIVTPN